MIPRVYTHKKARRLAGFYPDGRGDRIRTCDILVPNQARYQTALLPEDLPINAPDWIRHQEEQLNMEHPGLDRAHSGRFSPKCG